MTADASVDVASTLGGLEPEVTRSPLPGHEHQDGWGIMAFPFDSGHVLANRVVPRNDFAPYTSVWHRTPEGDWSIYVDGPRLDTACPRYWEPASEHVGLTDISVEWTGPGDLVVEMAEPELRWTASVAAGPVVRAVNAVASRLPDAVSRSGAMVRFAELLGEHLIGLGDITLSTPVASGQDATLLTRRLYPLGDGSAVFDGEDLGEPTVESETPTVGDARLPVRPLLWVGRAYLTILDDDAYEATLAELHGEGRADGGVSADPRSTGGHRTDRQVPGGTEGS